MVDPPSLEKIVAQSLDSEPVRKLLSPMTTELGGMLGDVANLLRFYANDNLQRIFVKWAENRPSNHKTIDAADFKRILHLLSVASMQSEDELQSRWAALLESAVSSPDEVLPSFGQTLAQISSDEAKFLDRFSAAVAAETGTGQLGERLPGEVGYDQALGVYEPSLTVQPEIFRLNPEPASDSRNPELMARAVLVIDDLVRMGIVSVRLDGMTSGGNEGLDTQLIQWYSLSPYGRRFIQAVS